MVEKIGGREKLVEVVGNTEHFVVQMTILTLKADDKSTTHLNVVELMINLEKRSPQDSAATEALFCDLLDLRRNKRVRNTLR